MHEYQILLRRKADVAKINSGFKARRVYGNVYGLRVFNGDETGFEYKRFKNQATGRGGKCCFCVARGETLSESMNSCMSRVV